MRILLIHDFYASDVPSGENQVVQREQDMLARRGHAVALYRGAGNTLRRDRALDKLRAGFLAPWNPAAAHTVGSWLREFNPDVVHVHNTFPSISPSIFHVLSQHAPTLLTVHNYRAFCAAGTPFRDGNVCTECLDKKSVLPSLRHGCYQGSRLATVPVALNIALHRHLRTWTAHIHCMIALTAFQRKLLAHAGFPERRIAVKPHFATPGMDPLPWEERDNAAVFVGRLTPEKGVLSLLQAWRAWGPSAPELRIIGDGPLEPHLKKLAAGLPIRLLGLKSQRDTQRAMAHAKLLIVPSKTYETFGLVVVEAFAVGTPVAVSDLGALPEFTSRGRTGLVFTAGNPASLLDTVRAAWRQHDRLRRMSDAAYREFHARYTEEINYRALTQLYETAITRVAPS